MKYLVAALVLAFSGALAAPVENLEVAFDDADGRFVYGFKLLLSGKEWLRSGPVAVRNNGEWFYSDDQSLKLNTIGEDTGEGFDMKSFDFIAGNGSFRFTAYVKVYKDIPVVEFGQVFKDGASSYFPSEEMLLSSFPTFLMEDTGADLGSIVFSGGQVSTTNVQKWPDHKLYSGLDGGFPVVFFDKEMENTIVMSPRNTFMSSVQATWNPKTIRTAVVGFGLLGSVKEVPEGYVYKTVLVAGQNITGTMEKWGKLLQQDYNREEWYRYNDLTNKYLGYWTDNGACYHYCTGDYDNYEDALIAEKEYADETGIPYRYLQLDSWWYYKGVHDGVKNWTAMPSVFPHGLAYIAEKWNTPIVAHNRFWSSNTDYAKQNGGSYNFIIHGDYALPDDTAFWPDLIGSAKSEWGLYVYEQDWLYTEYEGLSELATDLNLGRQWLMQMGDGALEKDLTIQYCMSWVRHLLQAVEIPVVTQVRVSGDYHPGNSQWQIGDSTILAHSLGIAAFKDNFHSMVVEDQCCNLKRETDPALEATIAALSKGPVGIGDEVGKSDKTQIMSTCRSDGRLLQPTRPAMSLDSTFVQRAFGTGGPAGQLYVAYTEVSIAVVTSARLTGISVYNIMFLSSSDCWIYMVLYCGC